MSGPDILQFSPFLFAFAGGYLLGSVPFGLVITRLAGLGDIRLLGSGNIGATNVLRTGRKDLAALTLVLDIGKAGFAALLAWWFWGYDVALVAGGAAFFGHCWPVWLKFKGGKGIATFFGLLFVASPWVGLVCAVLWLLTAFLTRYSSLAGLVSACAAPLMAWLLGPLSLFFLTLVLLCMIVWKHRPNIMRLIRGEEDKIARKKNDSQKKDLL